MPRASAIVVTVVLLACPGRDGSVAWAQSMRVGVNLDRVADWSTSRPFLDVFRRIRTWQTRNADGSGSWNSGHAEDMVVDEHGWPTRVPFDPRSGGPPQIVHSILTRFDEPGEYSFLYEGGGDLRLETPGAKRVALPTGGKRSHDFVVDAPGTLRIEIHRTSAPDHLRGFRILPRGQDSNDQSATFHPLFLARLEPFGLLRFMSWSRTNGSPLREWDERTLPSTYTQTGAGGVAFEYGLQLASELGADPWLCIPHAATDDFVRRYAGLVDELLAAERKVWIEYSNETWNTEFPQARYVREQGLALGLARNPKVAGHRFVARRSGEIWRIFREELGAERLVPVLASQAASLWVSEIRAEAVLDPGVNHAGVRPGVLAIAPYFGHRVGADELPPHVADYPSANDLLEKCSRILTRVRGDVAAHKSLADAHGWRLACYEGGQHLIGQGKAKDDPRLTDVLGEANRHPAMYERYREYLDLLQEEGVAVFCAFSFCSPWGKSGSWGMLEAIDQPVAEAPKYSAVLDWMRDAR